MRTTRETPTPIPAPLVEVEAAAVDDHAVPASPAPPSFKTEPPFRVGDSVDCRGWRGRLEPGVNPFGESGRERLVTTDEFGIEYWLDPVTDLYYTSPRFSQESLDASYQAPDAHLDTRAFADFDRKAWAASGDRSYVVSRLKCELVARHLEPGARILDVGCHMGLFVMLARDGGFEAEGIDVSEDAIRTGTEQLGIPTLRAATIERAEYTPGCMDGLVIWDVLEHVYNLMEVAEHCARVLRPGGYLFAQVPNHRGLSARLKTASCRLGLRGRRYHHFGFPWHLYHFSPRSLDLLMRRVGLRTVQLGSFSHRTKNGRAGGGAAGWINRRVEALALADYLYVVARKPMVRDGAEETAGTPGG